MKSEYTYLSADPLHSHGYLWPLVLKEVDRFARQTDVLDAGCGSGDFSVELSKRGYNVSAFDISESGIAVAKSRQEEIDFRVLSGYNDFNEVYGKKFDLIVSLEVIEHLYDPGKFVENCSNALKPGGKLILSTPYHGYLKNCVLALSGKMDQHFTALWDHGHIKFWSRKTLTTLLNRKELTVEKFTGAGRFPAMWKSMILVARKAP